MAIIAETFSRAGLIKKSRHGTNRVIAQCRKAGIAPAGSTVTPVRVQVGLILLKGGVPQDDPMASINIDRENNERDRVFSKEEFDWLLAVAPAHLKPILLTAYYTGLRRGELLKLTWDHVDLKAGMIRLRRENTKTQEGRIIPLTKELTQMLQGFRIYLTKDGQRVPQVFTYGGKSIGSIRRAFETACHRARIAGVVFHDLRQTFVTNMRRAVVDYFRIMAITGHRTMEVFKGYHTIDQNDLRQAVNQLDIYMDTTPTSPAECVCNSLPS
jgi:integrase